jgi:CBS domain-containing protein
MSTRENYAAGQEARTATTHHVGDGVDLRSSALMRYLAAMAVAEDRAGRDDATTRRGAQRAEQPSVRESGPTSLSTSWTIGGLLVEDVMTAPPVSVRRATPFKEVAQTLLDQRISSVPVVDDDRRVIGVVSASDLFNQIVKAAGPRHGRALRAGRAESRHQRAAVTAADLMTVPAICVPAGLTMLEAARKAADAGVRRMPVVDEAAVLVGVLTRSDLLRVFLRGDDEIQDYIAKAVVVQQFCLDPAGLQVSVRDGVVTLDGQVERPGVIDSLVDAVRATVGVVAVESSQLTSAHEDEPDRGAPGYLPPTH